MGRKITNRNKPKEHGREKPFHLHYVGGGDFFNYSDVCKLLKDVGYNSDQVDGVMVNCYRTNQIEVSFNEQVKVDAEILKLKGKIEELSLPYTATNYSHYEELMMIYGLPFGNLDKLRQQIRISIENFVSTATFLYREDEIENHGS